MHILFIYLIQEQSYNEFVVVLLVRIAANQQTVVELIGFFQRTFPQSPSVKSSSRKKQRDESEPAAVEVRIFAFVMLYQ